MNLIFENNSFILIKPERRIDFIYIIKKINLKIVILYLLGFYFYILSLTYVNGVEMRCFKSKGVQCYYTLAFLTFVSSIIISISIFLIINLKYSKIHLLIIIIKYIFLFNFDHNDGIQKHGIFNFIAFTLLTLLIYFFLNFIKFLYYLYKKKNIVLLILIISFIIFIIISFKIYKSNNFNCDNWVKGLNDSYIDNKLKDYPCSIKIPNNHSCYLSEIGQYFDFTSKYRKTCLDNDILKSEKKNF